MADLKTDVDDGMAFERQLVAAFERETQNNASPWPADIAEGIKSFAVRRERALGIYAGTRVM